MNTERHDATPERHVPGLVDLFVKLGYKDAVALFEGVTNIIVAQRSETGPAVDRNAVLEEAAARCDSYARTGREMATQAKDDSGRASSYSLQGLAAESCAVSIRALKNAAPGCGGPDQQTTLSQGSPAAEHSPESASTEYQHKPQHQPTEQRCVAAALNPAAAWPFPPDRKAGKFRLVYNKVTKKIDKVSNFDGLAVESFDPPVDCDGER